MDEQLKNAFMRYRKYKSITRWLIPAFIGDSVLVLIWVFILCFPGSHNLMPANSAGSTATDAVFTIPLVLVGLLLLLGVIVVAISKCPFCGKCVRNYPSREIHCIHCGKTLPDEFLAGE